MKAVEKLTEAINIHMDLGSKNEKTLTVLIRALEIVCEKKQIQCDEVFGQIALRL